MFDCMRDWQWWIPAGVGFLRTAIGIALVVAIYCFAFRKKPKGGVDLSDHPVFTFIMVSVLFASLIGGIAAGYWIGEKVDPAYFSKETACASCGAAILKTDEYCAVCGYEQIPTCDGCGTAIQDGNSFCAKCGTKVNEEQ